MGLVEHGLLCGLRLLSSIFDLITYVPYYILQGQKSRLDASNAVKAVREGDTWRSITDPELTTSPSAECSTLPELFELAVSRYADQPCLGTRQFIDEQEEEQPNGKVFKKSILGLYEWQSFTDVQSTVESLSQGLMARGLSSKSGACKALIFSETRADWMIAAQACFRINIPVVTLYATLGEMAVVHGIKETEVTHVITSAELLPNFKKLIPKLPSLRHVTFMKGRSVASRNTKSCEVNGVKVELMDDVIEVGRNAGKQNISRPVSSDLAVIMYTSGSTGIAKGVMLSHANVLASISGLLDRCQIQNTDTYCGYLPLAHILELCAELTCLYAGAAIGYSSPNTLSDASTAIRRGDKGDVSMLKPTLMACVPTVMDRIYKSVWDKVESGSLIKRVLFKFAVEYKKKWTSVGGTTPILDAVVFSSVTKLLGGRVRGMISGGAPLNSKTQEFLRLVICCPVGQGYGLTETCSAACAGANSDLTDGHVGGPLSCSAVRLIPWVEGGYRPSDNPPRGEVWVGGPNVAVGYYKNEEKTRDEFVNRDGTRWFMTGDIGQISSDGTLRIIDRKKDLVKLQAGEYVSLGKVEATLKLCPLIDNICVFANSQQTYCVAVVVPNPKALQSLADSLKVQGDWNAICSNKQITAAVLKEMQGQATSSNLFKFETPQKISLSTEVWTPDSGLVTDSLKLKRKPLEDFYRDIVERLYSQ